MRLSSGSRSVTRTPSFSSSVILLRLTRRYSRAWPMVITSSRIVCVAFPTFTWNRTGYVMMYMRYCTTSIDTAPARSTYIARHRLILIDLHAMLWAGSYHTGAARVGGRELACSSRGPGARTVSDPGTPEREHIHEVSNDHPWQSGMVGGGPQGDPDSHRSTARGRPTRYLDCACALGGGGGVHADRQ